MKSIFRILLVSVLVFVGCKGGFAQNAFEEGSIGINADFGMGHETWGTKFLPSFNLSGDYAIKNVIHDNGSISAGVMFGFGSTKEEFSLRAGVRGALHYTFVDNLDTYAGIGMGIKYSKGKESDDYNNNNSWWNSSTSLTSIHDPETHFVYVPLIAGARYMFTDIFGANAEVEISKFTYFKFGVSLLF